jgi:heptosyltransferase-2
MRIGIAPGSVWATKRWPIESFLRLAKQLLSQTNARLLILGSADEKAAAAELELGLAAEASRVINLAGRTSLDDLRAIYPSLSLLISNDSSPLHYASAFNVPSLAIFGATVPALGFGPLAEFSQVAQIDLPCRPCSDHGPMVCPLGHFRCMKDLEPERLASMALTILRQKGANSLEA